MYKSNSFNCNKEPEGCGNWRFIIAQENLTNSHKPVYFPLLDKVPLQKISVPLQKISAKDIIK